MPFRKVAFSASSLDSRLNFIKTPFSRQLLPTSRHTITHCDLSRHSSYPLEQTAIFYCRPHGTL